MPTDERMFMINRAVSCADVQGGRDDPTVLLVGSREIPDARLVRLNRAGHRLPPQAVPTIADELLAHTAGCGPRRG